MYIRHDVSLDQPAHSVRRELLEWPEGWLPLSVSRTLGERRYVVRVGFHAVGAVISKEVELTVGMPEAPGQWLTVPVSWRATGREQLFPILDGKLTVQPLGPHSSLLWMGATYQPPLGGLGRELDDLAMHNVAEATIREFVEGLGARLAALAMNRPG
jgi:hypothetical protein